MKVCVLPTILVIRHIIRLVIEPYSYYITNCTSTEFHIKYPRHPYSMDVVSRGSSSTDFLYKGYLPAFMLVKILEFVIGLDILLF